MSGDCPRCGVLFPPGRLDVCPLCLLDADVPPDLLGDSLQLGEEIGHGGMGTVYAALDTRLGRRVAVKFLPAARAADPDFRKRFDLEARALALLSHPNIVTVHGVGREGDQSYIVMELVDGRPLSELLPLAPERAREIALQACDALSYAHARGLVHRDIKPANMLIDTEGRLKIADFGLARLLHDPDWKVTATHQVVGTPAYMAPEARVGAPPDPRMDIYSLGVVLHELLTGHLPQGRSDIADPTLGRIARKAFAPTPDQRYASLEDMRRDLAGAIAPAGDALPTEEMGWIRAVAILLALATAVGLWALLLSVTPRVIHPREVEPLVMGRAEVLPDGRLVSRARFVTGPTFATLVMVVIALGAYGGLRRHWRTAGLDQPEPERRLREARLVLAGGVVCMLVWALRRLLLGGGLDEATAYFPILGGLLETATLFLFWVAVLQAWRTGRPLARENHLWLGVALALFPPVFELLAYLRSWSP